MSRAGERIYCQRCLAANTLGHELCARCGTSLMLVVRPAALRHEDDEVFAAGHFDEHLLERVSSLETKLARITDRLQHGLDLLLRHARGSYYDHVLLETLIGVLGETKAINQEKLVRVWRKRCEQAGKTPKSSGTNADSSEAARVAVMASYHGADKEAFGKLIEDGFCLLSAGRTSAAEKTSAGKTSRGIRCLEQAAALAPDNRPLHAFLGEYFFRTVKMTLASDYLGRAFKVEPRDYRVCLLLGLACGDTGDAARAKDLLTEAVHHGGASFAAHYALGRLLAAEAKWTDALAEFKRALHARSCPEAYYVIGSVYYQLGRYRLAARHLRKAIELDSEYAEAFYHLGLVHLREGERENANEAFAQARAANAADPRYYCTATEGLANQVSEAHPPSPLFGTTRQLRKRLVTGGDDRLAAAVREDALEQKFGQKWRLAR